MHIPETGEMFGLQLQWLESDVRCSTSVAGGQRSVFNFGGRRAEVTLVASGERERERRRDLKNVNKVDISNFN
jgi:hypothetical protein